MTLFVVSLPQVAAGRWRRWRPSGRPETSQSGSWKQVEDLFFFKCIYFWHICWLKVVWGWCLDEIGLWFFSCWRRRKFTRLKDLGKLDGNNKLDANKSCCHPSLDLFVLLTTWLELNSILWVPHANVMSCKGSIVGACGSRFGKQVDAMRIFPPPNKHQESIREVTYEPSTSGPCISVVYVLKKMNFPNTFQQVIAVNVVLWQKKLWESVQCWEQVPTLLWPRWEDQYLAVPEPDKSAEISLCCSEPSAHLWLRLLHGNKRCFQLQLRLWVHLSSGPSVVWGCLHQISASLSRVLARLGMMNNFTLAPLRSSGLCWSPSCCSSNSSFSLPTLLSLSLFFFLCSGMNVFCKSFQVSYHPNICMSKIFAKMFNWLCFALCCAVRANSWTKMKNEKLQRDGEFMVWLSAEFLFLFF